MLLTLINRLRPAAGEQSAFSGLLPQLLPNVCLCFSGVLGLIIIVMCSYISLPAKLSAAQL